MAIMEVTNFGAEHGSMEYVSLYGSRTLMSTRDMGIS